ncbi:O-acetylhomoserine aminocarboxypropyltransferase/cysteine synthase family protein [Campylobacter sp. RM15925]|uniref:O-acetylhomoserine aminocarboxypropyltransferase/cysteine synthase family protein n=1 Tax=Campylobacter sp. RM15925 TaxID=1705724 RepID=UPI001476472C|nr:O-acetylhomoserine aminocarboxypropyltransferase/cysteine synthase family protein [Campylobacter sp. RM15925]
MKQETIATHFGYDSKTGTGSMAIPLYQTTAYNFGTAETAANRFALAELGPIYTRLNNPTTDIFEARAAALENGVAAIATASGQAAIFYAVSNIAAAGENIIVAKKIYGGSNSLFHHTLKRFGIEARAFDSDNADDLENLIDGKTRAIFFETLSNPQIAIPNIEKIVAIASKHGIITIADNTVPTPILFRPIEHGVDVVVHSASKYMSGQGLSIGGVVVAGKGLNQKIITSARYAHFKGPDESYHGLIYADLTENFDIYTLRMRLSLIRDIGATISPFNSWQLIQGLETLAIRMKKHSENTLKIAEFLNSHKEVKSVTYPGLKSDAGYERAQKYFDGGMASGLLCFEVDSFEKAKKVLDKVKIFSIVVNIGDSKSIITHPASTTHQQIPPSELTKIGVPAGLIRLSIGIEDTDDLIEDLKQALEA